MEALPRSIEIKVSELIIKLEEGDFNEDDLELLLIRLREYSPKKSIFREVSHFVAHHKRNSGKTFDSVYKVYCRMRTYLKYQYRKETFDNSTPFEKWEFDAFKHQIEATKSGKIKDEIGISRKQALKKLSKYFQKQDGKYLLTDKHLPVVIPIINQALSFIEIKPLFESTSIIDDLIDVFNRNKIKHNPEKIRANSQLILIAILVLMHKRTFHLGNDLIGHSNITVPTDEFGKLCNLELRGTIKLPSGKDIIITLIQTNIGVDSLVAEELLIHRETNVKGIFCTVFDKDSELTLSNASGSYKLSRLKSA